MTTGCRMALSSPTPDRCGFRAPNDRLFSFVLKSIVDSKQLGRFACVTACPLVFRRFGSIISPKVSISANQAVSQVAPESPGLDNATESRYGRRAPVPSLARLSEAGETNETKYFQAPCSAERTGRQVIRFTKPTGSITGSRANWRSMCRRALAEDRTRERLSSPFQPPPV